MAPGAKNVTNGAESRSTAAGASTQRRRHSRRPGPVRTGPAASCVGIAVSCVGIAATWLRVAEVASMQARCWQVAAMRVPFCLVQCPHLDAVCDHVKELDTANAPRLSRKRPVAIPQTPHGHPVNAPRPSKKVRCMRISIIVAHSWLIGTAF